MTDEQKLRGLDATRFWAAMLVVLFHLVTMQDLPIPDYLTVINNQFGRMAVPLFFTVSAFALCFGYFGKLNRNSLILDYYLKRFFRIAPLFYIFMAVYILYIYLEYDKAISFTYIVSSFFFVFNLMPVYASGFVWASWSIGVEMLFYFILPMLFIAVGNLTRAGLFLLIAAFVSFHWTDAFIGAPARIRNYGHFSIAAHIHFFAGGLFVYFIYQLVQQDHASRARTVGYCALALSFLSLAILIAADDYVLHQTGLAGANVARSIPLASFVLGIALCPVAAICNSATIALGKASFSIYLFHPLIIGFYMNRGLYRAIEDQVADLGLAYLVCLAFTLVTLLPVSMLSYQYIERPGMRLYYRARPYVTPNAAIPVAAN